MPRLTIQSINSSINKAGGMLLSPFYIYLFLLLNILVVTISIATITIATISIDTISTDTISIVNISTSVKISIFRVSTLKPLDSHQSYLLVCIPRLYNIPS